jgi:hypothetical protein
MRTRSTLTNRSAACAAALALASGAAVIGTAAIEGHAHTRRARAPGAAAGSGSAVAPPRSSAPPWSAAVAAGRQTLLQKGGPDSDLFLWVHIDGPLIRGQVAQVTTDAVATELWGEGTIAYRSLLAEYGGFLGWVDGVARRAGRSGFRHTCLTTWSAGSQVIKDVCMGPDWPDAIVSLDGIYGHKPPGARPGDGQVVWDEGLEAVSRCALSAARGERIMVILHSGIETLFASSRETAAAIRGRVEVAMGGRMQADLRLTPADLDGHPFEQALELGDLHIVSFPGNTASEHIVEAHLYDEVWRRWIPWTQDGAPPAPAVASAPGASPPPPAAR